MDPPTILGPWSTPPRPTVLLKTAVLSDPTNALLPYPPGASPLPGRGP